MSHDPGLHDPDPGPQEKSMKKSCVSFETECRRTWPTCSEKYLWGVTLPCPFHLVDTHCFADCVAHIKVRCERHSGSFTFVIWKSIEWLGSQWLLQHQWYKLCAYQLICYIQSDLEYLSLRYLTSSLAEGNFQEWISHLNTRSTSHLIPPILNGSYTCTWHMS